MKNSNFLVKISSIEFPSGALFKYKASKPFPEFLLGVNKLYEDIDLNIPVTGFKIELFSFDIFSSSAILFLKLLIFSSYVISSINRIHKALTNSAYFNIFFSFSDIISTFLFFISLSMFIFSLLSILLPPSAPSQTSQWSLFLSSFSESF